MSMGLPERICSSDEEEEAGEEWGDWTEENAAGFKCLLCSKITPSADETLGHCSLEHSLDFTALRHQSKLDFYSSMRLLNFIRSEVASTRCWNCGAQFTGEKELLDHLNAAGHSTLPDSESWKDDKYLTPFLENDPLLYSFEEDIEDDMELEVIDREEVMNELASLNLNELVPTNEAPPPLEAEGESSSSLASALPLDDPFPTRKLSKKVSFTNVVKEDVRAVNQKYFSSYGEYGIHREMLGDKARTESYQSALLKNPKLLKNSVVMDIGCGTGILSLFAAKAGASKVIAVDGSEKMAIVARQIAKENGYVSEDKDSSVIQVFGGMVEELDSSLPLQPGSVDVMISEWMGYCLLYESMLDSVLHARDRWLKPGGAILPDIAQLYIAGFGKGGTSTGFWEDVYGFSMKHIGNEVAEHAAGAPLIDALKENDVVTNSSLIQKLDIATMKAEDVDFTSEFELKPNSPGVQWCYGVVVWFDVGFTERFCEDHPVTLSTSPFNQKTHWAQTLFTFIKPVVISGDSSSAPASSGELGESEFHPAAALRGRISIVRSSRHRSIDVSLETTAVGSDGSELVLPVQLFEI